MEQRQHIAISKRQHLVGGASRTWEAVAVWPPRHAHVFIIYQSEVRQLGGFVFRFFFFGFWPPPARHPRCFANFCHVKMKSTASFSFFVYLLLRPAERNIKLGPRHRKTCDALSVPQNLASSSQRGLHSSRCPSGGGLYLPRQRLAVIVFLVVFFLYTIKKLCARICVCASASFAEKKGDRYQRQFTRPSRLDSVTFFSL